MQKITKAVIPAAGLGTERLAFGRFCNLGNYAYLVEESNLWSYETEHYIFIGGIGVHDGHCTQARLCGLQAAVGL